MRAAGRDTGRLLLTVSLTVAITGIPSSRAWAPTDGTIRFAECDI